MENERPDGPPRSVRFIEGGPLELPPYMTVALFEPGVGQDKGMPGAKDGTVDWRGVFIETAYTESQVNDAIAAQTALGIDDRHCAFLHPAKPHQGD